MAKIQEINFPTITTLSVEVKALRIGKKQCTISVFKQLPEVKLTISNYEKVTLWGLVKYKEYYVVFQSGNNLIKSKIPEKKTLSIDEVYTTLKEEYHPILTRIKESYKEPSVSFYDSEFERETGFRFYEDEDVYFITDESKAKDFIKKNKESIELSKKFISERNKYYGKWNDFVDQCYQLDQLFIAV